MGAPQSISVSTRISEAFKSSGNDGFGWTVTLELVSDVSARMAGAGAIDVRPAIVAACMNPRRSNTEIFVSLIGALCGLPQPLSNALASSQFNRGRKRRLGVGSIAWQRIQNRASLNLIRACQTVMVASGLTLTFASPV